MNKLNVFDYDFFNNIDNYRVRFSVVVVVDLHRMCGCHTHPLICVSI